MCLINHLTENVGLFGVYVKAAVAVTSKRCPLAHSMTNEQIFTVNEVRHITAPVSALLPLNEALSSVRLSLRVSANTADAAVNFENVRVNEYDVVLIKQHKGPDGRI